MMLLLLMIIFFPCPFFFSSLDYRLIYLRVTGMDDGLSIKERICYVSLKTINFTSVIVIYSLCLFEINILQQFGRGHSSCLTMVQSLCLPILFLVYVIAFGFTDFCKNHRISYSHDSNKVNLSCCCRIKSFACFQ